MGRILIKKQRIGSTFTQATSYTYNLDGSINTETYPTSNVMSFAYDAAERPTSVRNTTLSISYVSACSTTPCYAPNGALQNINYDAAMTVANGYNNRFQPLFLSATGPAGAILSLNYDFHAGNGDNGNVYQIANGKDGTRTQNFAYDPLNRIQQAWTSGPNWGETFSIDPWGNLTNRGGIAGKISYEGLSAAVLTNNRLSGFGYDSAGNMTSNGSATYTYDAENHLLTSAGYTYNYDGDGNRVGKAIGSTGTIYWRDASGETIDEANLSDVMQEEYVFFGGKRVVRWDVPTGHRYYYFDDHLGSHSVMTDATGHCEQDIDFYPYGGIQTNYCSAVSQPYKFTGKERDVETGLDDYGKRYYANATGRWMSPDLVNVTKDRIVNPANTLNKYIYGGNNPLKYIDSDGQDITYFYDPGGVAGHAVLFAYNQATGDSAIESFGPKVHSPIWTGESNFDMNEFNSAQGLRDTYASLTIQTTPELAQQVIDFIRANPDPKLWTALSPNCSSEVQKILKQFKLSNSHSFWPGVTPKALWYSLLGRYNPSQAVWGQMTKPKQGNDYGKPRYDMFSLLWLSLPQSQPPATVTVTVTNCVTDDKGNKVCDTQ